MQVGNDNAAGEYYLTDIVSIISSKGYKINTCVASNDEVKELIQKGSYQNWSAFTEK